MTAYMQNTSTLIEQINAVYHFLTKYFHTPFKTKWR